MSGLLVKSTLIMRDNLAELTRRGLDHVPGWFVSVYLGVNNPTGNASSIDLTSAGKFASRASSREGESFSPEGEGIGRRPSQ